MAEQSIPVRMIRSAIAAHKSANRHLLQQDKKMKHFTDVTDLTVDFIAKHIELNSGVPIRTHARRPR